MISAMVCAAHKVSTFFQVGCWECRHFLPTFVKSLEQRIRRKKKKPPTRELVKSRGQPNETILRIYNEKEAAPLFTRSLLQTIVI